jgi:hypothetical protein
MRQTCGWVACVGAYAWHAGLVYRGACPVDATRSDIAHLRDVLNVGDVVRPLHPPFKQAIVFGLCQILVCSCYHLR